MPRYPAFLARRFEAMGVPCVVTEIEDLSPRFRRVHLAGEGLRGHEWEPCQVTSFRVSDTEFRHYTPDAIDSAAGTMSVLFYRHGQVNGGPPPGEAWLDALTVGQSVSAVRPGCARTFRPWRSSGDYLVCGDATTVGLWWSLRRWLPPDARVSGAVEVPEPDVGLVAEMLPGIDVLPLGSQPGAALTGWPGWPGWPGWAADRTGDLPEHSYLSGHAQTLQLVRDRLREQGVHRRSIHTQPYWATRKARL